eukprot:symbB.v1.2.037877.t1/scaffold5720.1/size24240/1
MDPILFEAIHGNFEAIMLALLSSMRRDRRKRSPLNCWCFRTCVRDGRSSACWTSKLDSSRVAGKVSLWPENQDWIFGAESHGKFEKFWLSIFLKGLCVLWVTWQHGRRLDLVSLRILAQMVRWFKSLQRLALLPMMTSLQLALTSFDSCNCTRGTFSFEQPDNKSRGRPVRSHSD